MPVKASAIDWSYYRRTLLPVTLPSIGEETRVVFRSGSINDWREVYAKAKASPDPPLALLDALLTALPDVTDEGRPVKITPALIRSLDVRDVQAIAGAIVDDVEGAINDYIGSARVRLSRPCGDVAEWWGDA